MCPDVHVADAAADQARQSCQMCSIRPERGLTRCGVQIPGRPPGAAAGPAPPGVKEVPPGEAIPDPAFDPDLVQIGVVRLPCRVCGACQSPTLPHLGLLQHGKEMCLAYVLPP